MPAWLIPAVKAVLPYVGSIVSAAAPVFTKKSANALANQATLLQQQITELQAAASANDDHIKGLAEQIRNTVEALEKGAALAEARHQRLRTLCVVAAVVSVAAFCVALLALIAR